jgi:hypothetical protein
MSCSVTPATWDWKASSRSALGRVYRSGPSPDWLKFKNPEAPAVQREAEEDWGKRAMTTLTMRYIKGDFVVTGPRRRADEIQDAQGGEGVVHGSPIRDRQSKRLAPAASANHQRAARRVGNRARNTCSRPALLKRRLTPPKCHKLQLLPRFGGAFLFGTSAGHIPYGRHLRRRDRRSSTAIWQSIRLLRSAKPKKGSFRRPKMRFRKAKIAAGRGYRRDAPWQ